jgi:hypothetical protein
MPPLPPNKEGIQIHTPLSLSDEPRDNKKKKRKENEEEKKKKENHI